MPEQDRLENVALHIQNARHSQNHHHTKQTFEAR